MLIQKENHSSTVSIKAYQPATEEIPASILVSGKTFHQTLLLTPSSIDTYQQVKNFSELDIQDFISKTDKQTEVVIIGTGAKHLFLPAQLSEAFHKQNIAVESMATREACHTFQVLAHEYRKVTALLFL